MSDGTVHMVNCDKENKNTENIIEVEKGDVQTKESKDANNDISAIDEKSPDFFVMVNAKEIDKCGNKDFEEDSFKAKESETKKEMKVDEADMNIPSSEDKEAAGKQVGDEKENQPCLKKLKTDAKITEPASLDNSKPMNDMKNEGDKDTDEEIEKVTGVCDEPERVLEKKD